MNISLTTRHWEEINYSITYSSKYFLLERRLGMISFLKLSQYCSRVLVLRIEQCQQGRI